MKYYVCFYFTFIISLSQAQRWTLADYSIIEDNQTLSVGLAGGLNVPQFHQLDVNLDNVLDLVIFDRDGYKTLVFEGSVEGDRLAYKVNDELASYFPVWQQFMIPKDYTGDGVPDLFQFSHGEIDGIRVFRGIEKGDHLEFELVVLDQLGKNVLNVLSGGDFSNLAVTKIDLPAIIDIDGDSDLDILTFPSSGGNLQLFKNQQADRGLAFDDIYFVLETTCWGGFKESDFSQEIALHPSPGGCASGLQSGDSRHNGSTTMIFDQNHDGLWDALIGDFTSENLVLLINGGSASEAWMVDQDAFFPSYNVSVNYPIFHAAYQLDANCDGKQDLLISPNVTNASAKRENVHYYENVGVTEDSFEFRTSTFLVESMIDFGLTSAPAVVDINADGWMDIVVGVGSTTVEDEITPKGLVSLLHNGDASHPNFTVDDEDYLGFSVFANGSQDFAPTFADMDDDGDMDIIVGDREGFLIYGENLAGPNQPLHIPNLQFGWKGIDAGESAIPSTADINGDGLLDLIVGEKNVNNSVVTNQLCGNLNYYQNIGTTESPDFISNSTTAPNSNCLGGINTRYPNQISGYSAPSFYDTGDSLLLFVGTQTGNIARYVVRAAGEVFPLVDSLTGGIDEGFRSIPAFTDFDNDNILEMVVGNFRGGLAIYHTDITTEGQLVRASNEVNGRLDFMAYPNPIEQGSILSLTGLPLSAYQVSLIHINGQVVFQNEGRGGQHQIRLPMVSGGLYLLRVSTANENKIIKILITE